MQIRLVCFLLSPLACGLVVEEHGRSDLAGEVQSNATAAMQPGPIEAVLGGGVAAFHIANDIKKKRKAAKEAAELQKLLSAIPAVQASVMEKLKTMVDSLPALGDAFAELLRSEHFQAAHAALHVAELLGVLRSGRTGDTAARKVASALEAQSVQTVEAMVATRRAFRDVDRVCIPHLANAARGRGLFGMLTGLTARMIGTARDDSARTVLTEGADAGESSECAALRGEVVTELNAVRDSIDRYQQFWASGHANPTFEDFGAGAYFFFHRHTWRHTCCPANCCNCARKSALHNFYEENATSCHTAVQGEECYKHVRWAMTEGIYSRPELYPGLKPTSSFAAFQDVVRRDHPSCERPCFDDDEAMESALRDDPVVGRRQNNVDLERSVHGIDEDGIIDLVTYEVANNGHVEEDESVYTAVERRLDAADEALQRYMASCAASSALLFSDGSEKTKRAAEVAMCVSDEEDAGAQTKAMSAWARFAIRHHAAQLETRWPHVACPALATSAVSMVANSEHWTAEEPPDLSAVEAVLAGYFREGCAREVVPGMRGSAETALLCLNGDLTVEPGSEAFNEAESEELRSRFAAGVVRLGLDARAKRTRCWREPGSGMGARAATSIWRALKEQAAVLKDIAAVAALVMPESTLNLLFAPGPWQSWGKGVWTAGGLLQLDV
jgi:hypothetical protein